MKLLIFHKKIKVKRKNFLLQILSQKSNLFFSHSLYHPLSHPFYILFGFYVLLVTQHYNKLKLKKTLREN